MISRHITCKPENDNYRRLANYIAAAGKQEEKCLMAWCAGCWAGDDYEMGIFEVGATQDLNTRSAKEKTYHLLVSFRPEDEPKLTSEVLKGIELDFATALGFEGHQRHCGVHKNTNNLHMHVAYNMIHPEKLTRREPYRDFLILERVCREVEQRHSLCVDNGRQKGSEKGVKGLRSPAATVEAHSGQQSFENYAKGQREAILAAVTKTATWRGVHQVLAVYGLEIKPHGAGLVIKSKNGAHAIKASSLDRSLSKSRMEKLLGRYQMPDASIANIHATTVYEAKPLHRDPERGSLYAEYQAGIAKRKASLASLNARDATAREHLAREWERKRQELEAMALTTRDRFRLLRQARQFEVESRKRLAKNMTKKRKELREEVPFTSWAGFLRTKAGQGNEVALAILRSRNEVVEAERDVQSDKPKTFEQQQAASLPWFERQREIREANGVNAMQKKELVAIARMQQLAAMEKASGSGGIFKDFSYRIDAKGTVLFTLTSGGLVRDAGDQIFFSAHDNAAQDVALKLAQVKWGKSISLEGNRVQPERQQRLMKQKNKEINQDVGWER